MNEISLNELESMAKRAARGSTLPWGLAQEAGKAVRWLGSCGLDGGGVLARYLSWRDGGASLPDVPQLGDGVWRSAGGRQCPIVVGTILNDRAGVLSGEAGFVFEDVACPLLVVPFADAAAKRAGRPVSITWSGVEAVLSDAACHVTGGDEAIYAQAAAAITCRPCDPPKGAALPRATRSGVGEADWSVLEQLAWRTYAPETDASRLKGAGAGLSDND